MARPRGDQQMTEARRQSILVSAFNVFAKSGFRGSSVKQVAELEGISEAGVLHHFKTKGQLLISVLEYRDRVTQFDQPGEQATGKIFIEGWLNLISQNMQNKGIVELFCILSAEATAEDHPAHQYFQDRYKFVRDLTGQYFAILKTEGKLRDGLDPAVAASALIAAADGYQVQWLLDPTWNMLEGHKTFFRSVLKAEHHDMV